MGFQTNGNLVQVRRASSLLVWTNRIGTGTGNPPDDGWLAFTRPKNASIFSLTCVGGGGGGGGGASGLAGTSRTGGAGGASGGWARLIIPAFFLPKRLCLWPGGGGLGDVAGSDGERGLKSCITDKPYRTVNVVADTILQSGSDTGTGGGAAFGGNPGSAVQASGVSGEVGASGVSGVYLGAGIFTSKNGQTSASGGNVNASGGNDTTAWGAVGIVTSGGAGGGSVSTGDVPFDGGIVVGRGLVADIPGGVAGVNGGDGLPGLKSLSPFLNTGGSGGAGGSTLGGKGGKGGWGSGGGGGGGGITGGAGGDGGPGFIFIEWW